jgi:hypothetical protein
MQKIYQNFSGGTNLKISVNLKESSQWMKMFWLLKDF